MKLSTLKKQLMKDPKFRKEWKLHADCWKEIASLIPPKFTTNSEGTKTITLNAW